MGVRARLAAPPTLADSVIMKFGLITETLMA